MDTLTTIGYASLWASGLVFYVTFLAATVRSPRWSWPERVPSGSYAVHNLTPRGTIYVLNIPTHRADWSSIADFWITWTTALATLSLSFWMGIELYDWGLATALTFNPCWNLRGATT